jgi:hypothetical protein
MKDAQARLDRGAKAARKIEDGARVLAAQARAAADEACAAKLFDLSADLREMGGHFEQAAASMAFGYAIGRRLKATVPGQGEIIALSSKD